MPAATAAPRIAGTTTKAAMPALRRRVLGDCVLGETDIAASIAVVGDGEESALRAASAVATLGSLSLTPEASVATARVSRIAP